MTMILWAVLSVTIIGLVCAVVLVIADKLMAVPVDETFEKVRACLPGANCGACGFAGCDGYAEALASGETENTTLCIPGGDTTAAAVAEVLGLAAGTVQRKVAFLRCNGTCKNTGTKFEYEGISTCAAAELLFAGPGECTYGCMGYGDCARACPYNAIEIRDGIAHIHQEICMGCGVCEATCPNQLIQILPLNVPYFVSCGNQEKGAMTRKRCAAGCIGCKSCEKACNTGAITVTNNLAIIDYTKCISCGSCVDVCPVHCIHELYSE